MLFKRFMKNKDFTNNDGNLERLHSRQNGLSKKIENKSINIPQKFSKNYLTLILAQKSTSLS